MDFRRVKKEEEVEFDRPAVPAKPSTYQIVTVGSYYGHPDQKVVETPKVSNVSPPQSVNRPYRVLLLGFDLPETIYLQTLLRQKLNPNEILAINHADMRTALQKGIADLVIASVSKPRERLEEFYGPPRPAEKVDLVYMIKEIAPNMVSKVVLYEPPSRPHRVIIDQHRATRMGINECVTSDERLTACLQVLDAERRKKDVTYAQAH